MDSKAVERSARRNLPNRWLTRLALGATACSALVAVSVAQQRPIPDGHLVSGTLSFDGQATAGDFTGTTKTVSGKVAGASDLTGVLGWVEAPVQTLKTGNGKRDKDLNKSMESDKYPTVRFDLSRVIGRGRSGDSVVVILEGQLRIHGVTQQVKLPGSIWFSGTNARVRTDFPLNLKDYRIGGLSKMLGMLKMYENIKVHADLVFRLDPEAAS
ncbi:MAG TPA: YceI family protein [Gemmatimonadales bacterium]|nr:YceI family protein [Gemmatimonadales bacterium]